jgi:hypothetical protein
MEHIIKEDAILEKDNVRFIVSKYDNGYGFLVYSCLDAKFKHIKDRDLDKYYIVSTNGE